MTRSLCYSVILFLAGLSLFGQSRYKAEYWEKNWRDWPRPVFDYSFDSFIAVENIGLREYFSSNSNSSGERYFHYARFQYPDQESIRDWGKILFQLPNYEHLLDVDFRIWEGEILLYEARASSIREKYLDSLSVDPHTKKLYAFSLAFPELKPGHIVEVMISLDGTPLPYFLAFNQSFPVHRSVQRIKIVSAFPLQYSASPAVKSDEKRVFDNKIYNFELINPAALSPELGLSTVPNEQPVVWIDWLDQVFLYDREESKTWNLVINNLFYDGALRDYSVYRNSLDYEFGLQQYFGSWIRPVRYFHERPSSLSSNEAYAEGRWRLSKTYAERWLKVEETLNQIIQENGVPNFTEALKMVYESQARASKAYLRTMPVFPPVFTEYGLLCSHYEALFKYFKLDYRLVLFYPQRGGQPDVAFPSPWPAYARGIAYRSSKGESWRYIIPGPYFGEFLEPGEVPPDLQGGKALLFSRDDTIPSWSTLPSANLAANGFRQIYNLQFKAGRKKAIIKDSLHLEGAFRSILASAYLRGDSAADQISFTNHQLITNALKSESLILGKTKSIDISDTTFLPLKLSQARTAKSMAFEDRDIAIPMAYSAEWEWRIAGVDSINVLWPKDLAPQNNHFFDWTYELQKMGPKAYSLNAKLKVKQAYLKKEAYGTYLAWYDLVSRDREIPILIEPQN